MRFEARMTANSILNTDRIDEDIPDQTSDAIINIIGRMVEGACNKESNVFGYGGWSHHILEVVRYGKVLAPVFHANSEIVEIAALLHDYASIKDSRFYADHHEQGALEAEKILRSCRYPEEKIEIVMQCIISHRASVTKPRVTPEAECLANADAVAHILQVPSLLRLAYVEYQMEIDEGAAWVRNKITRSWNKLSPTVQEKVRNRFEAALITLNKDCILEDLVADVATSTARGSSDGECFKPSIAESSQCSLSSDVPASDTLLQCPAE